MAILLSYEARPFTANASRSAHWTVTSRLTSQWRGAWCIIGRADVPLPPGPCRIIATPYLPNRRHTQDVAACFPAVKAALDGLVDGGLWPDDSAEWVTELTFRPAVYGEGERLQLELIPASAPVFQTR
jgi:crossover junction endodeoxyribonuclease RusA